MVKLGDYVRIRRGLYAGEYGYVVLIKRDMVHVRLDANLTAYVELKDIEVVN